MTKETFSPMPVSPMPARGVREHVRSLISKLAITFLNEKGQGTASLAEFRKWCGSEYAKGNDSIKFTQRCYESSGFTGRNELSFICSLPYNFWEYDRLQRWLAKSEQIGLTQSSSGRFIIEKR